MLNIIMKEDIIVDIFTTTEDAVEAAKKLTESTGERHTAYKFYIENMDFSSNELDEEEIYDMEEEGFSIPENVESLSVICSDLKKSLSRIRADYKKGKKIKERVIKFLNLLRKAEELVNYTWGAIDYYNEDPFYYDPNDDEYVAQIEASAKMINKMIKTFIKEIEIEKII